MPTADQLAGGGVLKVLKLKLSHWTDPIWNGAPERYSDGISIGGSPEYRKKVRARLDELKKRESGRAVLDKLDEQGRTGRGVVIYPHKGDPDTMADDVEDSRPVDAEVDPITGKVNIKKRGKGTSSEIDFDPDWQPRYPDGSSCLPPDGALMHEMVHAAHNGDGTNLSEFEMTDPAGGESNHEEAQTMGTAPYHDSGPYGAGLDTMLQPTENTYRRETGLPERTSHNGAKSLCPERPTPALPATEPSSTTFPREML